MVSQSVGEIDQAPAYAVDGGRTLHRWLDGMRRNSPVHQDPTTRVWTLYGYDEVSRAIRDTATFSSELWRYLPGSSDALVAGNLTAMDPPRHRSMRDLVSGSFTARAIAGLKSRIGAITAGLLDTVADRGEMDVVADLSDPLPVLVIGELLGLPAEDRTLFRSWAERMLSFGKDDLTDDAVRAQVEGAQKELLDYLHEQYRQRKACPGDDLISVLAHAEIGEQPLREEEAVNFANLLLLAGHVTTTLLLANIVLSLDENRDTAAQVRADYTSIPAVLEETLRYRPSIVANMRVTTKETTVGGHLLPAGQFVSLSFLSANRDERRFPDPHLFDIHRDTRHHLGMGHGVHYCLGAPLARLELRIATQALLDRFGSIEVTDTPITYYDTPGVAGPRAVRIAFRPN